MAADFDEADRPIVPPVQPGDVIVTADIPLAAAIIERGGTRSTRGAKGIPATLSKNA